MGIRSVEVRCTGRLGRTAGRWIIGEHGDRRVACDPVFKVGEAIAAEVWAAGRPVGIRAQGVVTDVRTDGAVPGVDIEWERLSSSDSPGHLIHFARHLLGRSLKDLRHDGPAPFQCYVAMNAPAPRTRSRGGAVTRTGDRVRVTTAVRHPPNAAKAVSAQAPERAEPAVVAPKSSEADAFLLNPDNLRNAKRARLDAPVTFFHRGEPHIGYARDLSRRGISVDVEGEPPPEGARVTIRLTLPFEDQSPTIIINASVVRHRGHGGPAGFAAHFLVVDELGETGVLEQFLAQRATKS